MDQSDDRTARQARRMWALVLALNLIVPLFFGWMMTDRGGRFGMAAGIGLVWYLGHRLCGMSESFGRALVFGGFVIAVTQACPILQIGSGIAGVGLAAALGQEVRPNDEEPGGMTELGGLIATGLTGLILMGTAAFCGEILAWLIARRPRARPVAGSILYDRQLDG